MSLIKVSTLNAQFYLIFYYKVLLQKMQISVFENTFHYTDSKETMLLSAMVLDDAVIPTLSTT